MKTWAEAVDEIMVLMRWLDEFPEHQSIADVQTELAAKRIANPEVYGEAEGRHAGTVTVRHDRFPKPIGALRP